MPIKSFDEVSEQVRRLMEVAGGSCDAYAEPKPESTPDSKKNYRIWEEDISSPLLDTPPETSVPRSSPDWLHGGGYLGAEEKNDQPSRDELDAFIRESLGFDPRSDDSEPSVPTGPDTRPPISDTLECGGMIQGYRGDTAHPPITNEYELIGPVEDAGELSELFLCFQEAEFKKDVEIPVKMDTGTYTLYNKPGRMELIDDVKGIRYIKADMAEMNHYSPIVEERDIFIWVVPTPEHQQGPSDDLGYIHDGWAFGRLNR